MDISLLHSLRWARRRFSGASGVWRRWQKQRIEINRTIIRYVIFVVLNFHSTILAANENGSFKFFPHRWERFCEWKLKRRRMLIQCERFIPVSHYQFLWIYQFSAIFAVIPESIYSMSYYNTEWTNNNIIAWWGEASNLFYYWLYPIDFNEFINFRASRMEEIEEQETQSSIKHLLFRCFHTIIDSSSMFRLSHSMWSVTR